MDWKTFIVEIVKALAWPAALVFLLYQLKDNLSEIFPRLKKLKHKDTEVEFYEKMKELSEEAKESGAAAPNIDLPAPVDEKADFLMKLSEVSPRSAVIESFRILEASSIRALTKAYPEFESGGKFNSSQMSQLLKNKVLDENEFHQFNKLRQLRNKAAHMEDFNSNLYPVSGYIDLALTLAHSLDTYEP